MNFNNQNLLYIILIGAASRCDRWSHLGAARRANMDMHYCICQKSLCSTNGAFIEVCAQNEQALSMFPVAKSGFQARG